MYSSDKHGRADYGSWAELNASQVQAITGQEGDGSLPLQEQRFAQLVYAVNPTTISLTGAVITTAQEPYSTIIEPLSPNATLIMKAAPGTEPAAPVWQIQQVFTSGSFTRVTWADGEAAFTKQATASGTYDYSL